MSIRVGSIVMMPDNKGVGEVVQIIHKVAMVQYFTNGYETDKEMFQLRDLVDTGRVVIAFFEAEQTTEIV